QLRVDVAVHAGDEKGGDGVDPADVLARLLGGGDALDEGFHDLLVTLHAEDESHVDADASGQHLADRGQALGGRGDLDQQVCTTNLSCQLLGLGDRPGSVVGEARVNLEGDPAVDPAGLLVDTSQNVAGILHVLDSHGEDRLVGGNAGGSELVQLLVVGIPLGHGGRE